MAKRNRQKVLDKRAAKRERLEKNEIQAEKFQEERKFQVKEIVPANINQMRAMKSFRDNQLTVLSGSAGTGKSMLAMHFAAQEWMAGRCNNIILTRPDATIGLSYPVTGSDFQKQVQLMFPLLLNLKKFLGVGVLKNALIMEDTDVLFSTKNGVRVANITKIGGASFDRNTLVIADEMQASTVAQAKALVTRLEEGCRLIITGDKVQSPIKGRNGLAYLEETLLKHPHHLAEVIRFNPDDVCRSGLSGHFTRIFENESDVW